MQEDLIFAGVAEITRGIVDFRLINARADATGRIVFVCVDSCELFGRLFDIPIMHTSTMLLLIFRIEPFVHFEKRFLKIGVNNSYIDC